MLLIFDLDGTLIDSEADLVSSVNATRNWMGLPPLADDVVASYVGNGAPVLIRRALGPAYSDELVQRALEFFIGYYSEHRLDHTRLYDGVEATLAALAADGHALAVLTNKPVRISTAILSDLGLASLFARIYGGNSFAEKKPHPVGVDTLLGELGMEREATLLVGDSEVDIQTAQNAGVRSCGVTFGFKPEAMRAAGPDFVIDRMEELAAVVERLHG